MRVPRVSVATVGFAVMVIAIDLAIIKSAWAEAFNPNSKSWILTGLLFLPVIDVLLMGLFRLRHRQGQTSGAVGFVVAGSVATGLLFASALLAPWMVFVTLWRTLVGPVENLVEGHLIEVVGDALAWSALVRWKISCGIELLLEMAVMSTPPLIIALLGGWVARRPWAGPVDPRRARRGRGPLRAGRKVGLAPGHGGSLALPGRAIGRRSLDSDRDCDRR